MKNLKEARIINIFLVLSILGFIISSYLVYIHYADTSSFCDFSPEFSCDIVNKSLYSEFPPGNGIPVSFLGALTFLFIFVVFILIKKKKFFKINKINFNKKTLINFIFYLLIFSLLFSLYLVYAELFLILSVFILFVLLDIIILII